VPRPLWRRWQRIAHRAAEVQSLALLALLYWIVVVPIGLVRRLGGRQTPRGGWKTRSASGAVTIEDARRQY
jgi:hypothetical protein